MTADKAVAESVKDNKVYRKDKPIMLKGESSGESNFKSIVDLFAMRVKY